MFHASSRQGRPIPERIYLDHAATSPLRPEAREAMEEGSRIWANPSSPHAEGRKARAALEDARERIRMALGWSGELIFTSGASEALSIALNRSKARRRIVSAVEHDAVFRAAPDALVLPVVEGRVELLGDLSDAIVAIQHVNPETGLIQPIADYLPAIHAAGGLLLCDCSQSAGKLALPDADMLVISAHKFGGPIGIGALLVKDFAMLEPIGGHERGYRQGTENLPGALGFAATLEAGGLERWATTTDQRNGFVDEICSRGDGIRLGPQVDYLFAVSHPSLSAQALLIRLDAMGFAVSAGSACSSGTLKKSRALDALGIDDETAGRTIRVSMGWNTTPGELDAFALAWKNLA